MATKYHTQASGSGTGELVPCKAEINCRLAGETDHMYFSTQAQAKTYSELVAAEQNGGAFGDGLSDKESLKLNELRAISELNRAKDNPAIEGDLYLAPHTSVERFYHMEKRVGSNYESRGGSVSTIAKRITAEFERAQVSGFVPKGSEIKISVKGKMNGKNIMVRLSVPRETSSAQKMQFQRNAAQIAESFSSSSYSLVDSDGFSKRERISGDKIEIELSQN